MLASKSTSGQELEMGAKLGGDGDSQIVDINVTPLVDIVLVLILHGDSPYIVETQHRVNLPEAATGEPTDQALLASTSPLQEN